MTKTLVATPDPPEPPLSWSVDYTTSTYSSSLYTITVDQEM